MRTRSRRETQPAAVSAWVARTELRRWGYAERCGAAQTPLQPGQSSQAATTGPRCARIRPSMSRRLVAKPSEVLHTPASQWPDRRWHPWRMAL